MYKIPANTVFIGKTLHYLPSCHSTNDIAASLLTSGEAKHGMVVITENQTAGRGQAGNRWEAAPEENFTFSLILIHDNWPANNHFALTMVTTVAIKKFLEMNGIPGLVKWPNDIYYKNKKMGGILINNSVAGKQISDSVIGIGLNVNQEHFNYPKAVSMKMITGRNYRLDHLIENLFLEFEKSLNMQKHNPEKLKFEYMQGFMGLNEKRKFYDTVNDREFSAYVKGVDEIGRLQLIENNISKTFNLKEVVWL